MSIFPSVTSLAIGTLPGAIADTLFKSKSTRAIGSILAPCVVSETHEDQYTITNHPVQSGAIISDHMYAQPMRVDIEVIYSQSTANSALNAYAAIFGLGSTGMTLRQYYDQFLALQASKTPFDIITGKRSYSNMVIESISVRTNKETENLLALNLRCREIIIVTTDITSLDSANMSDPYTNGAPVQTGVKQLSPSSSALTINFQSQGALA